MSGYRSLFAYWIGGASLSGGAPPAVGTLPNNPFLASPGRLMGR
jgi:hypothetical protein